MFALALKRQGLRKIIATVTGTFAMFQALYFKYIISFNLTITSLTGTINIPIVQMRN